MKVIVNENRSIEAKKTAGTQNENNITELEIIVPSIYEDYNKKIVFITPEGIVWDIIQGNKYIIKKSITKYSTVQYYIWLTKGEEDFRSVEKTLTFNANTDASGEITDEEVNGVNTVINLLEEEITKVTDLTAIIQAKLDNGEFKGEKGDKGDAGSIKFIIVAELPSEDIDESAIYMKRIETEEEQNTYEEYIYVNGVWELLGTAKVEVDLTDYVKNTDYATTSKAGIVKGSSRYSVNMDNFGHINTTTISYNDYATKDNNSFIGKGTLDNVLSGKFITLTQAEYDELVTAGTIDENTYYYIKEE